MCPAGGEGGSRGAVVSGRPLLSAFSGSVCDAARTLVARLPPPRARPPQPGPVYPHHAPAHDDSESLSLSLSQFDGEYLNRSTAAIFGFILVLLCGLHT